jgi:hypothetical protein
MKTDVSNWSKEEAFSFLGLLQMWGYTDAGLECVGDKWFAVWRAKCRG